MSANTMMRWPNPRKTVNLPACLYNNRNNSPSLRPGQKVPTRQFQQRHMTTTYSAITPSYGHLPMQVPVHLDHPTRTHHHSRKPIRSVTRKPRLTQSSITDRSHRTNMQVIAEHRPTPHCLRCQKWHRNRHASASLRNTTQIMACNPHLQQVIQHHIRRITRISQPVLLAVHAFPMPRTELLLPRDLCCLHRLV